MAMINYIKLPQYVSRMPNRDYSSGLSTLGQGIAQGVQNFIVNRNAKNNYELRKSAQENALARQKVSDERATKVFNRQEKSWQQEDQAKADAAKRVAAKTIGTVGMSLATKTPEEYIQLRPQYVEFMINNGVPQDKAVQMFPEQFQNEQEFVQWREGMNKMGQTAMELYGQAAEKKYRNDYIGRFNKMKDAGQLPEGVESPGQLQRWEKEQAGPSFEEREKIKLEYKKKFSDYKRRLPKEARKKIPGGDVGEYIYLKDSEQLPEGVKSFEQYIAWKHPKAEGGKTEKEREVITRRNALPKIEELASKNPMAAYKRGWRMNDDGTVFTRLDTGAPEKLKNFDKALGKRGMTKAIKTAGEQWDDAVELKQLLRDPEVKTILNQMDEAGLWDRFKGKWSNTARKWLQSHGYGNNTKIATAVARMQRMASNERKAYLGTAVTLNELRSVTGWMPDAGDSYSEMLNKVDLIEKEGEEVFTRFLDLYKDTANMAPFYEAFGIDRFKNKSDIETAADELIRKYSGGQQ
jgi:hypothetical protein